MHLRAGWKNFDFLRMVPQNRRYFCVIYDYASKADLRKGHFLNIIKLMHSWREVGQTQKLGEKAVKGMGERQFESISTGL